MTRMMNMNVTRMMNMNEDLKCPKCGGELFKGRARYADEEVWAECWECMRCRVMFWWSDLRNELAVTDS